MITISIFVFSLLCIIFFLLQTVFKVGSAIIAGLTSALSTVGIAAGGALLLIIAIFTLNGVIQLFIQGAVLKAIGTLVIIGFVLFIAIIFGGAVIFELFLTVCSLILSAFVYIFSLLVGFFESGSALFERLHVKYLNKIIAKIERC